MITTMMIKAVSNAIRDEACGIADATSEECVLIDVTTQMESEHERDGNELDLLIKLASDSNCAYLYLTP